ncbi:hypothetical protein [Arachidicoccus sp.]|uniref:hypothetical protein n=1 Tax=Arachidicoccus sp. TaxID=1872624 RepID=UPI003D23E945
MKKISVLIYFLVAGFVSLNAQQYNYVVIKKDAHPAIKSAAKIIAEKFQIPLAHIKEVDKIDNPKTGEIVLDCGNPSPSERQFIGQNPAETKFDGYLVRFKNGGAMIIGKRPRSLLYAAGDFNGWKEKHSGIYIRQPDFKIRDVNLGGNDNITQLIVKTGANIVFQNIHPNFITLKNSFPQIYNNIARQDQQRLLIQENRAGLFAAKLAKECHDADVDFYPFLYGNDIVKWSPILAKAIYKTYPNIEGKRAVSSWEKATLNPSLNITWDIIHAIVDEYMQTMHGDGMMATFWDDYGLYSQDSLSVANGMNLFDNELQKIVGVYDDVLSKDKKPLIIRTWSSGRAHWVPLRNNRNQIELQFVHAPGYGGFSGSRLDTWGKVIDSLPSRIILQTKAYMSDCFPAARDNTLIGKTKSHPQIIEYQMTGQTTGLYFLPAVNVNYTDSTIKRAHRIIGENSGTSLFYGATHQAHYNLLNDIANSVNLFAWKELSWNVNTSVDAIWSAWATPIYGEKAAPYIIHALELSEPAVNKVFSTLGFGWETNSGFPGSIARREVLLMYTNRFYLPEYQHYLLPNKENIQRVIQEKEEALSDIDSMFIYLNKAKPYLKAGQYEELYTRFNWLKYVAIENKLVEVSYWRFRYLRYLYSLRTTDIAEMKAIDTAYKQATYYKDSLFQYAPQTRFSGYDGKLGEVGGRRRIGLGNPMSIMNDIEKQSKQFVVEFTGPEN